MILRYFRRVYRLHGIRPFGFSLIVALVIILGLDQYGTEYSEADDERDSLTRQEQNMRNKIAQQPRIERSLQDSHAALSANARVIQGVTVEQSATEFVATVTKKLADANVAHPRVTALPPKIWGEKGDQEKKDEKTERDGKSDKDDKGNKADKGNRGEAGAELGAEIEFTATTRQLVTLMQSSRNGTPAIRVSALEVRVANAETPKEVEVKARVEAAYVPAGIAAPDPLGKSTRGTRRGAGTSAR